MLQSRICFSGVTFFVACLCWFCLLIGSDGQITHPAEVTALQAIKKSLIDPNNNLSNWNRGDPCMSNWIGVLCFNMTMNDGYLHVRELQLLNMDLLGNLSPELGRLSYMEILDVMWNNISGSIPKEIGNITTLELLLLNGNQLTGSLPEEIGYLPNLDRIQIDQNQISGPLPKSFANLNKTRHFHMNNNSISGQIPPELSRLPSLVYMLLDNNNLSGYLPPELANLPSLRILQLDNNHFDGGTIPDTYGNMYHLLKLSLRNCGLQGPIPDLSRIQNLAYIDLSSNHLNGSIPQYQLSTKITTIDLSNNNLTGTIPSNFSRLPQLQKLSIENNSLSGSVQSSIWQNRTSSSSEKFIVDLRNNMLSNISGSADLPPNVTVRLQGNPICSTTNLVQFCGSQNEYVSTMLRLTNSKVDCPALACPAPYDYSPKSTVPCFCSAPLLVGYRLKSPGFIDFQPYINTFDVYLSSALKLNIYQLDIHEIFWEKGPRLNMYLKFFPAYTENPSPRFNKSQVKQIRSMFTEWKIPDSDLFGPYELLNFTLSDPYKDVIASDPSSSKSGISKGALAGFVSGTIAGAVAILLLLILILHMRKRLAISKRHQSGTLEEDVWGHHMTETGSLDIPMYNFSTLASATNNFSEANKLGVGGFGPVYKGKLEDGQEIAVKRLSTHSRQGIVEFKNEILLISKLQHRNLVRLLGYCIKGDEKLLIYEYLQNKSLDKVLFDRKTALQLDWAKRFNIIQGIARGLLYLHRDSCLRIIHRDLKASNILLDDKMIPKISDFGLARAFQITQEVVNTHKVVGTFGYISPEYALRGTFSEKSDVYSFGVLLLEIISGMKNTSFYYKENYLNLLGYAWHLWEEDKGLDLMDEQLIDSCPTEDFLKCMQIGLLCVHCHAADRPTMSAVVRMVTTNTDIPQPKQPTFDQGWLNSDVHSHVSMSTVEAR